MSTVSVSLSSAEAHLIGAGLNTILTQFANWERLKPTTWTHPKAEFKESGFDRGELSSAHLASLRSAAAKVAAAVVAPGRNSSQRMSAFELAAAMLGVRVAKTAFRHGHVEPWRRDYARACEELQSKLEILRKRAKRGSVAAEGEKAFSDASRRWGRLVRWIRVHLLYCGCNRPQVPFRGRIQRLRKQEKVKAWMERLKEELPARGRRIPSDAKLKKLIERALREGRRRARRPAKTSGRRASPTGDEYIARYVSERCPFWPEKTLWGRREVLRKAVPYVQ